MYTHTQCFSLYLLDLNSFSKVSCHTCTACKSQNLLFNPPVWYICLRGQGPKNCCHCGALLKAWRLAKYKLSQLLLGMNSADIFWSLRVCWDGYRIKQVSGCCLCLFKDPWLFYEKFSHLLPRWCWVLDFSRSLLEGRLFKVIYQHWYQAILWQK